MTWLLRLLKRGIAYVVSYARRRYTSSAPQLVVQEPLTTWMRWSLSSAAVSFVQRRLRL